MPPKKASQVPVKKAQKSSSEEESSEEESSEEETIKAPVKGI